ncbi:carcinoma-related EF-hand protein [Phyllostomus discolor]|uniref:Carcinoma-related EF-hand protein n=1 Tax=Phyllostomus discolor TaxID=89673 RepID=A0A834E8F8_9CHIR|nr:carcinoma-related EF-hand protein [Phyllostomus discolor]
MPSMWKTPHGSDAMPERMVKIIGSKHFQYLTEKPKIKENENLKPETRRVLQKSVTGNTKQMSRDPPGPSRLTDHQINHDPDDGEESKHPEKYQKPENNQKLLMGALSSRFLDGRVRLICGKHGLYVTLSLLKTLLNQDLAYQNEIKWQNFVELLSKAFSDLSSDLPTGKKGKETSATSVQAEVPAMSQGKTEHMKSPEEELQPENLPTETSAPKDPLGSLMIRPVLQTFVSPAMKNKSAEYEMWINRFRKLENVLYLCDLSNTGVLEKEQARYLIHNYNLIYNLFLSPRKIDQALRRFRSGENMPLESALWYLKEL